MATPRALEAPRKAGCCGAPEETLEKISWDEFFQIFDENKLAFLYQDRTEGGDTSRFNKFVSRP